MARATVNDKVQTGIMLFILGVLGYVGITTMNNTETSARVEERVIGIERSISDLKQNLYDHNDQNKESFSALWKTVDKIRDKQSNSD